MSEEAKSEVQAETTAVDNAAPLKGIVGIKIGMTRAFTEDARMIPVTVISAEGVVVSQVKTKATDGYDAVQIAYDDVKETHLTKAEAQHFAKKGVALKRHVREFRVSDTTPFKVGQAVPVTVFAKGQWLQVSGLTKGHGYAGVIKRHGFHGLPHSHGHGEYRRHPGSSGAQGPQHVLPGTRKPGHMGHVMNTAPKVEIFGIDTERNLILLRGSVPGPRGNFVVLKPTSRKVSSAQAQRATGKPAAKAKK